VPDLERDVPGARFKLGRRGLLHVGRLIDASRVERRAPDGVRAVSEQISC